VSAVAAAKANMKTDFLIIIVNLLLFNHWIG